MNVFDWLEYSSSPIDKAWVNDYKRKTTQLSLHELVAIGRRTERVWPAFKAEDGILQSNGKVIVYTPMRIRSLLVPIVYLVVKRKINKAIEAFLIDHECKNRRIQVEHRFFLPRTFTMPLKPIVDIDMNVLAHELEASMAPLGFVAHVAAFWEKIKKAV